MMKKGTCVFASKPFIENIVRQELPVNDRLKKNIFRKNSLHKGNIRRIEGRSYHRRQTQTKEKIPQKTEIVTEREIQNYS